MSLFRRDAAPKEKLEGVLTFFGSHHALRAEGVLKRAWPCRPTYPGPRAISPNCGVALRFVHERKGEIADLLKRSSVQYEAIHYYPEQ